MAYVPSRCTACLHVKAGTLSGSPQAARALMLRDIPRKTWAKCSPPVSQRVTRESQSVSSLKPGRLSQNGYYFFYWESPQLGDFKKNQAYEPLSTWDDPPSSWPGGRTRTPGFSTTGFRFFSHHGDSDSRALDGVNFKAIFCETKISDVTLGCHKSWWSVAILLPSLKLTVPKGA